MWWITPHLQTNSFTPVVFTLRNTGTTVLDAATVAVGGYSAAAPRLNPGDSASVTVLYKTGAAITNPTYTITAGDSQLASGTLHLDYNDIGISSMKVVEESQGKRTVLVTLYNDSAAKLAGSGLHGGAALLQRFGAQPARQCHFVGKPKRCIQLGEYYHPHRQRFKPPGPGQHGPAGHL